MKRITAHETHGPVSARLFYGRSDLHGIQNLALQEPIRDILDRGAILEHQQIDFTE